MKLRFLPDWDMLSKGLSRTPREPPSLIAPERNVSPIWELSVKIPTMEESDNELLETRDVGTPAVAGVRCLAWSPLASRTHYKESRSYE